ncbi:porphobilinogen synthase [Methanococcus aeolicus]|uniref:porphobilinogen synthase n=1 Tax=Methanococcus aeolicus TaxID=42879 RepID=UPI0021C916F4|nr:porphobilinogen synthase [Methanococcus aeolicus]UXM84499.1 porphobilinogen synthase [Methanococcus aeolicus]
MIKRPRRLRNTKKIRDLVGETTLIKNDLIMPLFIDETLKGSEKKEITSMPNQYRFSTEGVVEECKEIADLGVPAVILFGIPKYKDEIASSAYDENGVIQKAIRNIKAELGNDLLVIADTCLCEYTSHGHCGLIDYKNNKVLNDETLPILSKIAISYANSGVDIIAPSDMMDGRVGALRKALDENNHTDIPIMSYGAKYASSFYGPFRDAAESAPKSEIKDRKTYQMDYRNSNEAIREIELDIEEGADLILVKPALPYLDIIKIANDNFNIPIGAYCVSGEYSMIEAASINGWINRTDAIIETLHSIKRAGASFIINYWAKEIAKYL